MRFNIKFPQSLSSRLYKLLLLLLLLIIPPFKLAAYNYDNYDADIDDIYYNLDATNKTATLIGTSSNYDKKIKIPSTINCRGNTYNVTSIGGGAFRGYKSLSSIDIPNSVTSIGNEAFYGCRSLTSVIIPNSVTSIGYATFSGCESLSSIDIPNSVTSIGDNAFCGCSSLTSITIPNSVTSIGDNTFSGCSSLTSIDIPNSVISIGNYAFSGCRSLTSITIPNSVISIGAATFYGCESLTSITIPISVTSIGNGAFEYCNLEKITIPFSVTYIGDNAFIGCSRLKSVSLPKQSKFPKSCFPSSTKITYYEPFPISWDDLNAKMLSWNEYYTKNSKEKRTLTDIKAIETLVNSEISKWQVKDEFETTQEWKERVNETTRKKKAEELSNHYLSIYKQESEKIIEEQQKLAKEYETYKEDLLKEYYNEHTVFAKENFKNSYFELKTYDADNESFMISSSNYGDILLPVSRDKARGFKEYWEVIKMRMEPVFVPNGKEVALNKIIFKFQGKSYVYDSHTEANYSITDIKYNFQPIQIAEISIKDLNITNPEIDSNIESTLVSKSASDVLAVQNVTPERKSVAATDRSDVDFAIPRNKTDKETPTFAVIIANEKYSSVSDVPYASKDGEILEKYLTRTVGLPTDHVKTYKNASYGNMVAALKHIKNLSAAYGKDLNLIFYYAGHGMPDEKTKNPMLLPVDADAAMPETCYELGSVLNTLGGLNAYSVVVMLDACFSGTERGDGMLTAARGIRIKSNQSEPIGNMVILSASQGDETAYPFDNEQHGLFTYFLLKKLQETKGDVSLGELSDYIIEQVKRQSVVSNGKLQTPTVSVSSAFSNSWRNHKLK